MTTAAVNVRERAETERSASEATHTAELRIAEGQLGRYLAPPLTASYPLEYAYALLGDVRAKRVLDLGCGSGENSVVLARRGAKVLGLDLSEALIQLARRRMEAHGEASEFCAASAHQLPLKDQSIDVVFGIAILHHLDLRLVRAEVLRVLKNGGRAIFQEPVRESTLLRKVRPLFPWRDPDVSPYEHPLTRADIEFLRAGFASSSIRAFVLPHVTLAERLRFGSAVVDRSYQLDKRILNHVPRLAGFAAIRVIELSK